MIKALKTLRNEKGWSMRKLAKMSGLAMATILSAEQGKTLVRIGTLKKLATAFDLPLAEMQKIADGDREIKRLVLYRRRAGLTLRELAEKVGVVWQTISYIESGRTKPHRNTLAKIADALVISPSCRGALFLEYGLAPPTEDVNVAMKAVVLFYCGSEKYNG
ncbi:MAG: hypothetical protein DRP52_02590 [Planctomycetota bacterium]|nr:MAG: hypothetical protein DRP52_02590 [Planctomycetota bacterium]